MRTDAARSVGAPSLPMPWWPLDMDPALCRDPPRSAPGLLRTEGSNPAKEPCPCEGTIKVISMTGPRHSATQQPYSEEPPAKSATDQGCPQTHTVRSRRTCQARNHSSNMQVPCCPDKAVSVTSGRPMHRLCTRAACMKIRMACAAFDEL